MRKEEKNNRPEAYPKPSVADQQLKDQPEFIDQEPNEFNDKKVSDISTTELDEDKATDSRKESE